MRSRSGGNGLPAPLERATRPPFTDRSELAGWLFPAALKIGIITIPNRDGTGRLRAQRGEREADRRALEYGEFSPLLAGDLSPSEDGPATKPHARPTAGASRERARSSGRPGSLDGGCPEENTELQRHLV